MANIEITKTGNSIVVTFNDYTSSENVNDSKESFDCRDIVEVQLDKSLDHITIMMRDAHGNRKWDVTHDQDYDGSDYFIIDSVENLNPVSQSDLFDKITALRG